MALFIVHKLRKEQALRKHGLRGQIAVSVLLKLCISDNKRCHITDAHERNSIFKSKQYTIYDPWGPEKYNYTMMKYEVMFYSRNTGTKHLNTLKFPLPVVLKNKIKQNYDI